MPFWKFLLPVVAICSIAAGALLIVRSQVVETGGGAAGTGNHAGSTSQDGKPHSGPPVVGSVLPEMELMRFGDKKVPIREIYSKVLMINFWASWCEACMVEMPSIQRLRDLYKDKGFEVAAVNVDEKPDQVIPRIVKQLGLTLPIFLDTDQKLTELFDVHAIPLTVIIDRDRKILYIENGEREWDAIEIRSLMDRWLST